MSVYPYLVAVWLLLIGAYGMATSRNLVHAILSLSVAQSGTYVLLLAVGFEWGGQPPILGEPAKRPLRHAVDPLVQAMTLTDIVVSATVTAILLAIAIQIHKHSRTLDPDELNAVHG